jgi:hypothetical protein
MAEAEEKKEPTKAEKPPEKKEPTVEVLDPEGEEEMEDEGEDFMEALRDFFTTFRPEVGEIITAFAERMREGPKYKWKTTVGVFLLLAFIIAILAFLTFHEKVSGEGLAFLIGAIVGYLFTFLKQSVIGR